MRHTLVSNSLAAYGCDHCKGILISLLAYRDWRERTGVAQQPGGEADQPVLVSDTRDALTCGKCSNLMTKYRISANAPNRIDFCARCEDVWLDEGEWELIETLVGSHQLANIASQPWQYRVMSDSREEMEARRLSGELGDDYEKMLEVAGWLERHPSRLEILAYLSGRARSST